MSLEMSTNKVICSRCGKAYGSRKKFFPASYAQNYKGLGSIHICRDCVDMMFNVYLSQCNNAKDAVRQMCRKLDLYWDEKVFESAMKHSASRTVLTSYMVKLNTDRYAGKCYDDTLLNEGALWTFGQSHSTNSGGEQSDPIATSDAHIEVKLDPIEITEDMINYWGSGYTPAMYTELEHRRRHWMKYYPDDAGGVDMGTDMLIKQICNLEVKINRDQAEGKSIDKNINVLNSLLGSLNIKPVQKSSEDDASIEKTPYGVWINRLEHHRPVSEPSEEFKDVDGIVKRVTTWFFGHAGKMLGIKNLYTKLYDDAIAKYRIARPDIEEDDDDAFLCDFFGEGGDLNNGESDRSTEHKE